MSWLDKLLGKGLAEPKPVPIAVPAPVLPNPRRDRAAIEVARFTRAVEQCRIHVANGEKGAERLAELERELAYHQALLELEQQRQEGSA